MPDMTAQGFVDALLRHQRELLAAKNFNYKLDYTVIRPAPPERRAAIVRDLVERFGAVVGRLRELMPDPYKWPRRVSERVVVQELEEEIDVIFRLLRQAMARERWPISGKDLDSFLLTAARARKRLLDDEWWSAVANSAPAQGFSPPAVPSVMELIDAKLFFLGPGDVVDGSTVSEVKALQASINHAPLVLRPSFPVSALLLRELGPSAPTAWIDLLNHCVVFPGRPPTETWRSLLTQLANSIPPEELHDRVIRWLRELEKPVGKMREEGHWAVAPLEEALLSGLVWALCVVPRPSTVDATLVVCRSVLKPWENGQRSLPVALCCVDALSAVTGDLRLKGLKALRSKTRHKAVLKAIDKALSASSTEKAGVVKRSKARTR